MEPIVIEATRGAVVEARHRVHAVAVSDGTIVECCGDPSRLAYFRSSAKPLQVLPIIRVLPELDDVEIAIACASHLHRPEQLAPVLSLLARAQSAEDELECGADPTKLEHNCSGKHAAMLALCDRMGWAKPGYRLAGHPCQAAMLEQVAEAAEVEPSSVPTAIDGCGVVTYALTLERMARAFARLESLDGGSRAAGAMRANPELIRGPGEADTELMRLEQGWVAKGGAEGLLCAASRDRVGVALKVEDGSTRAVRSGIAWFLARLGYDTGALGVVPVTNSRAEVVGELRAV